jgi:hypothetical protein
MLAGEVASASLEWCTAEAIRAADNDAFVMQGHRRHRNSRLLVKFQACDDDLRNVGKQTAQQIAADVHNNMCMERCVHAPPKALRLHR